MDKQLPVDQDDLSDLERRLSAWQPTTDGLNADALLFAAGMAAARQNCSRLWPTLCALLIVPVAGLGAWAVSERSERLALSTEFAKQVPSPGVIPQAPKGEAMHFTYSPSPNDYFHQRRRMENDPSYYLAAVTPVTSEVADPSVPPTTILRAGQWSDLLE